MKTYALIKRLIAVSNKDWRACDKECPNLLYPGCNECELFGKLLKTGEFILRAEDCLRCEEASDALINVSRLIS